MDTLVTQLVGYAEASDFSRLPAEAVRDCKRRIIDTFACAVGALDEPLCRMARQHAQRFIGSPASTSTVWGCDWKSTAEAAAFANGTMLRFLDISDMYRTKSGGHPSDVIAAVLAVAEAEGASGKETINAIVLAYDIYCCVCDAIDLNTMGWDQPVYGVLAGVIGAGKLLGLNQEQMANAIALAVTPNMATYQTRRGELSAWKGCAAANASRNAVFAAYLARDGFTGPTAPFEGPAGLFDIVGRFELELPDGKRKPHSITRTHLKCFPVCYHGQAAVWAALELRPQVDAASIAAVRISTHQPAFNAMAGDKSRWAPKTRETADHSLPYVVALALADGEITTESFAEDKLKSSAMLELMAKTSVTVSPALDAQYPVTAPCSISIETRDGRVHTADVSSPKGHAAAPLDDTDLDGKFRNMFRGFTDPARCDTLLRALWQFEELEQVGSFLDELGKAGRA